MQEKFLKWFDKNKHSDKPIILLTRFFYSITKDWVHATLQVLFAFLLPYTVKIKWLFIVLIIVIALTSLWYSIVNAYRNRRNRIEKNAKTIQDEINVCMVSLDSFINNDLKKDGIFEFACDLVSSSLYSSLINVLDSELRISIVQQFVENDKKNCVMLSRRSKTRQKSIKSQKSVKYKKGKDYYYQKILCDNKDDMIILSEEQIQKNFYFKNKNKKTPICQYIGIPDKNSTNEIVFLIQLDAMTENAFGKDEIEINKFYEDYIYPYICFLRHAYNIEKLLKIKEN